MEMSKEEQRRLIAAGARMQEAEDALFDFRKTWDSRRMTRELTTRVMGADGHCRPITKVNPDFDECELRDYQKREAELKSDFDLKKNEYMALENELVAKGVDVEKFLNTLDDL